MKTHLTSIISHAINILTAFFVDGLETLLPVRTPRQNASNIPHIQIINQGRIFGSEPFTHSTEGSLAFFSYGNPAIKKCIWNFKYYLKPSAIEQLSSIMADELIAHLSDTLSNNPLNAPALLIYCPSSSFASGNKAFDHMEKFALHIETQMNCLEPFMQICINAVCINKDIEPQHRGNKKERFAWANNRFSISELFEDHLKSSSPAHIICIDDIITTEATSRAIKNLFSRKSAVKHTRQEFFALCFTPLTK